jgi:hypothetical protein
LREVCEFEVQVALSPLLVKEIKELCENQYGLFSVEVTNKGDKASAIQLFGIRAYDAKQAVLEFIRQRSAPQISQSQFILPEPLRRSSIIHDFKYPDYW